MLVQQCTAILSEKIQLTEKFIHLYFEMKEPQALQFQAGQYASIGFPDQPVRRSYSIASNPENEHGFEMLIDTTPQGIGSTYLSQLPIGGEIKFLAPMGMFILATGEQAAKEKSLVFVGTGSGIAPLRSMVLNLLQTQLDKREMWIYWGLRYVDDIFWAEDFHELSKSFPNFHFHLTLSKAIEDWPLCRGRVTDCLSIHELPPEAGYYLCGNKAMIEDVAKLLIEQKNIPKEMVHHEKFY